jgi:hypothetical protein
MTAAPLGGQLERQLRCYNKRVSEYMLYNFATGNANLIQIYAESGTVV